MADRVARWVVVAGGLAIIASILGILVFIVLEVWPLLRGARVTRHGLVSVDATFSALVSDEYRESLVGLDENGRVLALRASDGTVVASRPLLPAADPPDTARATDARTSPGGRILGAATDDGRIVALPVEWRISFSGDVRQIEPVLGEPVVFSMDPAGQPLLAWSVDVAEDGSGIAAAVTREGSLVVSRRAVTENLLTGETRESFLVESRPLRVQPTRLLVDLPQTSLFAGTADGGLLWWGLSGELARPQPVSAGPSPITAMTILIGGRSLIVGQADGALSVWFPVRQSDESFRLTRIRDLPSHPDAIRHLSPSLRNKGFLAWSGDGLLGLYHSTSGERLWAGELEMDVRSLFYTPRSDAAFVAGERSILALAIDNPHPEVTLATLFGRVWYEGYEEPELVWQSTGGSDDFEPKLSLTPLLVGTLKGTFFSLLLAIPLGVLGAMYVSQFMHRAYQRTVKPVVEVMASLPTVVLGFLAGLWLAPRLESIVPGVLASTVILPVLVVVAGYLWSRLPNRILRRFPDGTEAFLFILVLALGLYLAIRLSAPMEIAFFGGDFQTWLRETTGLPYDQRNAIVVGLAMGFAVIPIIFAISEDAFTNVPQSLAAGSMALGASRWQTVVRVILPAASPGIFSAVMVGFGRAVGETMIVLMATGNTPIMSWNPFNGFRTLSANIAVEIPEAPVGGTLYRTLFLAALVLFVLTFLVNTVAEIVRARLRERFSRL